MTGRLYVVGTPIGNMSDMSPRAVKTLSEVDFIAAEDTRVSAVLLAKFGIKTPMVSYHKFTGEQREQAIVDRILSGESCAVITDAGMPCISDPGEQLVKLCRDYGVEIEAVPGPSAVITALSVSGLDTSRFSFEGFLSVTKKQREKHLNEVKNLPHTLIFYEAPHKLKNTLADLLEALGDRPASLCRELTKLHEEVIRSTLSGLNELYKDKTPRGEYVIVVQGNYQNIGISETTLEDAVKKAAALIADGMKPSEACRQAALTSAFKKSEIYKEYLRAYAPENKE